MYNVCGKRKSFQTIAKLQMKMLRASAMETHAHAQIQYTVCVCGSLHMDPCCCFAHSQHLSGTLGKVYWPSLLLIWQLLTRHVLLCTVHRALWRSYVANKLINTHTLTLIIHISQSICRNSNAFAPQCNLHAVLFVRPLFIMFYFFRALQLLVDRYCCCCCWQKFTHTLTHAHACTYTQIAAHWIR